MLTLTSKELEALQQIFENLSLGRMSVTFRAKLNDLELDEEKNSDSYLIRWLRARDLNVVKAEDMLRKSLKWRVENNIDSILDWKAPEIYSKIYPSQICGYDNQGHPVAIIPSRFFNMDVFWELDREEYIKYNIQNIEKMLIAMKKYSTPENRISEFIGIYDVAGFDFRAIFNRRGKQMMQDSTKVFEENYPELVHKCYIVYAPRIFTIVFAMMKQFVPKRTISKIHIFDSNPTKWAQTLLEKIPAEVLPSRYGGANEEFDRTAFVGCGVNACDRRVSLKGEIEIDGFIETHVQAGKKVEYEYEVEIPKSAIVWCFKTNNYDIGFSIVFGESKDEVIVPYQRLESQNKKQNGSILCEKSGRYTLLFDNTYSRIRSKTLHLKVEIEDPFTEAESNDEIISKLHEGTE